jgi:hypothetical protein
MVTSSQVYLKTNAGEEGYIDKVKRRKEEEGDQ